MIEIKSIKEKFNDKWWSLLGHHFDKPYMQQVYLKIMEDAHKGYKIFPKASVIYDRFKLINPDDVRVVFLIKEPIGCYKQSTEWQLMQRMIENECFDGLYLNLEDNMDYMIPQGVIHLSPSLTICNKTDHSNIGWSKFTSDIIDILRTTDNKVLFVSNSDVLTDYIMNSDAYKFDIIPLRDDCFKYINIWMQKEYNTKINW